jgi:hypothetical protein
VAESKYFGTTVTNENCIQEENKSTINLGNACYLAVYNILTWAPKVREEYRLRMFHNSMPRRIFRTKKEEVNSRLGKVAL